MSQKEGKNVSNLSHDKVSELFIVKNVIINGIKKVTIRLLKKEINI